MSKPGKHIRAGTFKPGESDQALAFEQGVGLNRWAQPGPRRDPEAMARAAAVLRDQGGLPGPAALAFTQLLLNLANYAGRRQAQDMMSAFLDAADIGYQQPD